MKTKGLKKKHRLSPQEKKLLSYKKDCRNMYGESGARSRFSIARRKAEVNQAFRHAQKQILHQLEDVSEESSEKIEEKVKNIKKKFWRKCSDSPLARQVVYKLARRQKEGINLHWIESDLLKETENNDFRVKQLSQ